MFFSYSSLTLNSTSSRSLFCFSKTKKQTKPHIFPSTALDWMLSSMFSEFVTLTISKCSSDFLNNAPDGDHSVLATLLTV